MAWWWQSQSAWVNSSRILCPVTTNTLCHLPVLPASPAQLHPCWALSTGMDSLWNTISSTGPATPKHQHSLVCTKVGNPWAELPLQHPQQDPAQDVLLALQFTLYFFSLLAGLKPGLQSMFSSFSPLAKIFSKSRKWLTIAEKPCDKSEKCLIGTLKRLLQYRDLFQFAFCRFTVVSYFFFTCQCWKYVFYALKTEICSIPRTPGGGTPRTTVNIRFLLQMATLN